MLLVRDRQRVLAILAIAVLTACGGRSGSTPSPSEAGGAPSNQAQAPTDDQASSGPFLLTISTPRLTWAVNQPIDLTASLVYRGDAPSVALAGSGSGLVGFGVEELTGRRRVDPGWLDDCRHYQLDRNVPLSRHYVKSGGFTDEDPDRDWLRQFFSDPLLRLPAGRWRITAYADFFEQTCGMDQIHRQFQTSLDFTVT